MKLKVVLGVVVLVGGGGYAGWYHWRTRDQSAVERGYRVAYAHGCFTCHGSGGYLGMPNPGHKLGDVPPWTVGVMPFYAKDDGEIREWIVDGVPRRVREDPSLMSDRRNAIITMPAWRGLLSSRELDDLVAYVRAFADVRPPPEGTGASRGYDVAVKYGCFNCHGPEGRGTAPNPRSFKGYIPSWDGPDFTELVHDDGEIRTWILDGGPPRFRADPIASFFLGRQLIHMPAYRGHLSGDEVERLVDYIQWLRAGTMRSAS